MVGIGAVKYNDLSQHYSKDIIFDWNKILNIKGNSGPYLQYTYTRCRAVMKKGQTEKMSLIILKYLPLNRRRRSFENSL